MYKSIFNFKVFLLLSLLTITQLIYAQGHQAQAGKTTKIAENIYTFTVHGHYISMFVVTKEGVIVFETMNTPFAKAKVAAIKKITDKPIKYALHSHNHWDHTSGGQVYLDEGATTIAHLEAYEWMAANPYPDMVLPKEVWAGNRKDIELGGVKVELHYLGMNHGLGMTIFLLPQQKVAYIADIVAPNRVMFSVMPDFNTREWERSLKEILQMDFNKAVFSHNESKYRLQGGTKKDVRLQLEYIQDLRAGLRAELKKGTNPYLIPKILKLPKYKHWAMYDQWLEMNIWKVFSEETLGPFPWRPAPSYQDKKSTGRK